ncbi:MAG: hypothetical protein Q4C57_01440 [Bacillota bacterium]|nr:hypothetical protein [Bacillota bacterium]
MKFVKRISLFFIYPLSMFAIGFASNMLMMDYFYPNNLKRDNAKAQEMPVKEQMPVSVMDTPVVTANTRYVIQEYNVLNGQLTQNEETAPDKFIGLDRTKLAQEIENYNTKPSLTDQEKGFTFMELVSFSNDKVVVKKSYEKQEVAKGFFLLNENHYVVVYDSELSGIYMNTNILVEELPEKLQNEIIHMKYIQDEGELFNFLESYSS